MKLDRASGADQGIGALRGDSGTPQLLLVSSQRWLDTVRPALAARDAGFEVVLLAPAGHPIARLPWVRPVGDFRPRRAAESVADVLQGLPIDFVAAVDDVAATGVIDAYRSGRLSVDASRVVERSMGDPTSFGLRYDRAEICGLARQRGLPTPDFISVAGPGEAEAVIRQLGTPVVIKADRTSSGSGVRLAVDAHEVRDAVWRMSRRIPDGTGLDVLPKRCAQVVRTSLFRGSRRGITAQRFVAGEQSTLSAACWEGELLDLVSLRVVQTRFDTGPATVVEAFTHPDMTAAARVIAKELGLSGFFGLDFIISARTGEAVLLELNPRLTPTAHLHLVAGPGLFGLLAQRLCSSQTAPPNPAEIYPATGAIALYPQEMERDPASAHLRSAYHEIPRHAPDVVELITRLTRMPSPV